jgi:hypothetical protein
MESKKMRFWKYCVTISLTALHSCSKEENGTETQKVLSWKTIKCGFADTPGIGWAAIGTDLTFIKTDRSVIAAEAGAMRSCWKSAIDQKIEPEKCIFWPASLSEYTRWDPIKVTDPTIQSVIPKCGYNILEDFPVSKSSTPSATSSQKIDGNSNTSSLKRTLIPLSDPLLDLYCYSILRGRKNFKEKIEGDGPNLANIAMFGALNQCVKFVEEENSKGPIQYIPSECKGLQCNVRVNL